MGERGNTKNIEYYIYNLTKEQSILILNDTKLLHNLTLKGPGLQHSLDI
jgi:hypothetical protein